MTRPRFDEVQALLFRRRLLIEAGCTVGLVTIGDEPHHPDEVAQFAELPLVATLPEDAAVASASCGGRFDRKRLVRTRLWMTILGLAEHLWPSAGVPAAVAHNGNDARPAEEAVTAKPGNNGLNGLSESDEPYASRHTDHAREPIV